MRIVSYAFENLSAFVNKFIKTCWVRIRSRFANTSCFRGLNSINIFYKSACRYNIWTTLFKVALTGCTSKLGVKIFFSIMFRSSNNLTCERSNCAVESISSRSFCFSGSEVYFKTLLVNCTMHLRGVIISWVTLEVKSVRTLLFSDILENFLTSVISRIVINVASVF